MKIVIITLAFIFTLNPLLTKADWKMEKMSKISLEMKKQILKDTEKTYSNKGGNHITTLEDLEKNSYVYYFLDKNNKMAIAVLMKETPFGIKITNVSTDQSNESKLILVNSICRIVDEEGYYAEISGRVLDLILAVCEKRFVSKKESAIILSELGKAIDFDYPEDEKNLKKKLSQFPEAAPYKRSIILDGKPQQVEKVLVGHPITDGKNLNPNELIKKFESKNHIKSCL